MNKNIDLTKILKNCPKGWKFYSSVYGDVEFIKILHTISVPYWPQKDRLFLPDMEVRNYPIQLATNIGEYRVSKAGEHKKGVGECTLFPSREQRDWSKFTAPWYKKERFDPKTLKPFDKVLVRSENIFNWNCSLFSNIDDFSSKYPFSCLSMCYRFCIPYNDETKHLVGTKDEAPEYYRYWED